MASRCSNRSNPFTPNSSSPITEVKLESLGYARYFRLLKQIDIRVPNMEVQIQIASLFDALDEQISDLIVLSDLELESLHELEAVHVAGSI